MDCLGHLERMVEMDKMGHREHLELPVVKEFREKLDPGAMLVHLDSLAGQV